MSSVVAMLLCWKHVSQRPLWSSFSCSALEVGISVQKYLNLVADCILFGFFNAAEALFMVWEVSKGPAVFGWQHKMSFYTLRLQRKQTASYVVICGRILSMFAPPPFPLCLFFFFDTDHPTAPP